jgi:hypothetical protein
MTFLFWCISSTTDSPSATLHSIAIFLLTSSVIKSAVFKEFISTSFVVSIQIGGGGGIRGDRKALLKIIGYLLSAR